MSRLLTPVRSLSAVAAVVAIAVIATLAGPATAIRSSEARIDHTINSRQGTLTSRVNGTAEGQRAVNAVFVPHSFQVGKDGNLYATGLLKGQIEGKRHHFKRQITMQVRRVDGHSVVNRSGARSSSARASCEVLDLVIRPIDLNLLGLKVHLDRVHLNITAQSGSGNLLGNLLCAVVNLLNQGGPLADLIDQLSALLNQIIGRLNL